MEAPANSNDAGAMRRALLLFAETAMRPVIRILLRYGLSYPEYNQIARKLFVDVAMEEPEFRIVRRRRQHKARAACMTGLSREEVLRLAESPRPADDAELRSANRAARVFEGWTSESRYRDGALPAVLPFRAPGGQRSFSELVQRYSGDIPPRAVLDELLRAGACSASADDEIRIIADAYITQPLDIDVMTSSAFRISSTLATADAGLSIRTVPALRELSPPLLSSVS